MILQALPFPSAMLSKDWDRDEGVCAMRCERSSSALRATEKGADSGAEWQKRQVREPSSGEGVEKSQQRRDERRGEEGK
jgi:hypothetical protein